MLAMRGVVYRSEVWAWPMLMLDHNQAFMACPMLREYTCRWRQWEPGGRIDFDPGATPEDIALVEDYVAKLQST